MELSDLIKGLEGMLPEKVPYGDLIGAEGLYAHSGPLVYEDPEPYFIEQAIAELKKLSEIQDILGPVYDTDHLRELMEADKAGRVYKFRFGVGSTVYRVWTRPDGTHKFISEDKIECLRDMMRAELWAEPYSTREEAEAALEKMKEAAHE